MLAQQEKISGSWKNILSDNGVVWCVAYIATLALPWALIFHRTAADVSCAVIGICFFLHSYQSKQWGWTNDAIVRIGLITWAWLLLVVSPLALSPPESASVAIFWFRYILLYAAIRHWVLSAESSRILLAQIILLMLCFAMLDTCWQYITGISLTGHIRDANGRLSGPMSNVKVGIFIAKLLMPSIGTYIGNAIIEKQRLRISVALLLLLTGLATILVSGERSAFLASIFATGAVAFYILITHPHFRKIAALCIVSISLITGLMIKTQDWVQSRLSYLSYQISHYAETPYIHLAKNAISIGNDHWKAGAGIKSFRALCPDYEKDDTATYCNLHPHNFYLEWYAETGLVGVLLFVMMVFYLFYLATSQLQQHHKANKIPAIFALACIIINFFPFMATQSMFSNWPALLLWYSIGIASASFNDDPGKS